MKEKMKVFQSVVAAALLVIVAAVPSSASVSYDFTGSGGFIGAGSQPFTVTSGSSAVAVSGFTHTGGGSGDAPFASLDPTGIHQNGNGLGVRSSFFDLNQLDSVQDDELMRFDFGRSVKLLSVVLSLATGNDEFDIAIDNVDVDVVGLLGTDEINDFVSNGFASSPIFDYTIDFSGVSLGSFSQLDFYTNDEGDGYKIVSITVAELPEASSIVAWTMLSSLGMVFCRRKPR